MKKVTGIGGVFFKCEDREKMRAWYAEHLGIHSEEWGGVFEWRDKTNPDIEGYTAWSPFKQETRYFDPSKQDFMINYRVDDLEALTAELKKAGIEEVGEKRIQRLWQVHLDHGSRRPQDRTLGTTQRPQ